MSCRLLSPLFPTADFFEEAETGNEGWEEEEEGKGGIWSMAASFPFLKYFFFANYEVRKKEQFRNRPKIYFDTICLSGI